MPVLKDYREFAGRHWETGTVRNALAYRGVKAPHTGQAPTEALLMGISGGIVFGYFTFEYKGYLPHIALLTRNTFDPRDTLLERLAIPQDVARTDKPQKGEANLLDALESGRPALVWADTFSLPYNDIPHDERNWAMMPVLVYGFEGGVAYLADRSACPLEVSAEVLAAARGRVKQHEFRVITLDAPNWDRLPAAVMQGIRQAVALFAEAPPKGRRENFGAAALAHWADMLTNTRNKQSWARTFEPGERLWMALVGDQVQPGSFGWLWRDAGNAAERGMYADFLDEAAAILGKPALREAAALFQRAEAEWAVLADLLLPDESPAFHEAKDLLIRKRTLFIEEGAGPLDDIRQANARLNALRQEAARDFPLTDSEVAALRERLAAQVLKVRHVEGEAFRALSAAAV